MKWFAIALILSSFSLEAKRLSSPPVEAKEPVEEDLFNKDKQVFSFHGEFLFWWVEEGALDYALKMTQPAWSSVSNSYAQGRFETSSFNGEPGFRLKASYFRAPRYWEVWWQYTRLTSRGSDHASKPAANQEYLTGTWPQIFTNPLASAKTSLHLNYNVGDFFVDRYFIPNPHLRLRLLGGATVAWMDQDWHIDYRDSGSSLTKIRSRWKYIGGGLRIGTMVDWFWWSDIYMTGLATTAITLGTYRNQTKQTTNVALDEGDNPAIPVRNADYRDVRPAFTIQGVFGPSWQKTFTSTRWEVFVGYEINTWFNLQEVYRSTAATPTQAKETWINTSAIALQGLTTRVTVDF